MFATPIMKSLLASKVLRDDQSVMIGDKNLPTYLILFNLKDFDIIMGVDWSATHHALVDCFHKKVTF